MCYSMVVLCLQKSFLSFLAINPRWSSGRFQSCHRGLSHISNSPSTSIRSPSHQGVWQQTRQICLLDLSFRVGGNTMQYVEHCDRCQKGRKSRNHRWLTHLTGPTGAVIMLLGASEFSRWFNWLVTKDQGRACGRDIYLTHPTWINFTWYSNTSHILSVSLFDQTLLGYCI